MMAGRKISLRRFVAATLVGVTTLALTILGLTAYRAEARRQRTALDGLSKRQASELAVACQLAEERFAMGEPGRRLRAFYGALAP